LEAHEGVLVQGVDDDLEPIHARITRWFDNGVRPVYRLKLRNGAEIRATRNHEFLTEAGWRTLESLSPGDYVATPRKLEAVSEGKAIDEREFARYKTLAYLLADGSLSHSSPAFFSSNRALLVD